jgi:hypothetical protein
MEQLVDAMLTSNALLNMEEMGMMPRISINRAKRTSSEMLPAAPPSSPIDKEDCSYLNPPQAKKIASTAMMIMQQRSSKSKTAMEAAYVSTKSNTESELHKVWSYTPSSSPTIPQYFDDLFCNFTEMPVHELFLKGLLSYAVGNTPANFCSGMIRFAKSYLKWEENSACKQWIEALETYIQDVSRSWSCITTSRSGLNVRVYRDFNSAAASTQITYFLQDSILGYHYVPIGTHVVPAGSLAGRCARTGKLLDNSAIKCAPHTSHANVSKWIRLRFASSASIYYNSICI